MEDLNKLLRESRNLLQLCTLLDKSGQCKIMVDKIDKALTIPIVMQQSEQLCINCKEKPANRGLGKHKLMCSDCWNNQSD